MPYPIVTEDAGKLWFRRWQDECREAGGRVSPSEAPKVETHPGGEPWDWEAGIAALTEDLLRLYEELKNLSADERNRVFESTAAVTLHETLPDHDALRDPQFWCWFATVPGRELIETRYPFKPNSAPSDAPLPAEPNPDAKPPNYLPARKNFVGEKAQESLFFRLWIRAEMARHMEPGVEDAYDHARGASIDFWRSHLMRVLYAHHRPLLQAFVDFQFPGPERATPRLPIAQIRQLAKDIKKVCANVTVEALDRAQCQALIERVWVRTEAAQAWIKG